MHDTWNSSFSHDYSMTLSLLFPLIALYFEKLPTAYVPPDNMTKDFFRHVFLHTHIWQIESSII